MGTSTRCTTAIASSLLRSPACDILPGRTKSSTGTGEKAFFFILFRVLVSLVFFELRSAEEGSNEDDEVDGC